MADRRANFALALQPSDPVVLDTVYMVFDSYPDGNTTRWAFLYTSDNAAASFSPSPPDGIGCTADTDGGTESPDTITTADANHADFTFADPVTLGGNFTVNAAGGTTFDRPGATLIVPQSLLMP